MVVAAATPAPTRAAAADAGLVDHDGAAAGGHQPRTFPPSLAAPTTVPPADSADDGSGGDHDVVHPRRV